MADLIITAANVAFTSGSAPTAVQVGEAVTAGQALYPASDGKYYLGDADDSTKDAVTKIALSAAAADQYTAVAGDGDTLDLGATLTVGETYVLSDTPGGIAPIGDLATGDYVTSLGVASAAGAITLDIDATGVVKP